MFKCNICNEEILAENAISHDQYHALSRANIVLAIKNLSGSERVLIFSLFCRYCGEQKDDGGYCPNHPER